MEAESGENRPYRTLAAIYDELVGTTAFDCWLDNFERLCNRNEIAFEVAADVACGTGLAAAHLASRCDRVYAVDASRAMLERAASRGAAENITYLCQGFTELELPEKVDLLTCNFDSLNYLTEEDDLREAIMRFGVCVKSGGWAVFDMNTCRQLAVGWPEAVLVHRLSRGMSVWESAWDLETRTNTLIMTNFIDNGEGLYEMSEEIHRERAYDLDLLIEMCSTAGFSRVEAFDAKGLAIVGKDTRRVQFAAAR